MEFLEVLVNPEGWPALGFHPSRNMKLEDDTMSENNSISTKLTELRHEH